MNALVSYQSKLPMQVQESDMHRVATATGAQTQTTVNNLNPKVLGTVEAFEEKQVNLRVAACLWCFLYAGQPSTKHWIHAMVIVQTGRLAC